VEYDLTRLQLPEDKPTLTAEDICQGQNEVAGTKDLLTWIEFYFTHSDTKIYIEKVIARELGVFTHGLIKRTDQMTKYQLSVLWNKVIEEIYAKLNR
jgi:hypothetical protein